MAVKIGSARIDENGKAMGGKAGDQTGREVSTQDWYKHSKGWRVLRAKSAEVAEKIAWDMQAACDNKHIGYDQGSRDTLYSAAKKVGFDCAKVTTDVETDCSALVRVCCCYAGIMVGNFRTPNEASMLLATGAFVELTGSKYTDSSVYLKRGDILVTKTQGHTVVVLSNGSKAASDNPIKEETYKVDGYVLVRHGSYYVRLLPNKDSQSIGVVRTDDKIDYLGVTENGWYKVLYKGQVGWVSVKCGDVKAEDRVMLTVKNGNYHIRKEANSGSKSITIVKKGEQVEYLGKKENGWSNVSYQGYEGWMSDKAF